MSGVRIRKAALLAAACALLGAAAPAPQQAPSLTSLAECRLSYVDAKKATGALTPIRSIDESTASEQNVTDTYAHQGVTLFGLKVKMFTLNEFDDTRIHQHMYGAEVDDSFANARTALLRAHGKARCELVDVDEPGSRTCLIHLRSDNTDQEHDVDLLLAERNNSVRSGCVYSSPGALH
ncbi:hypothetical protein P1X14_00965 [Sphingomonas sp. AOB5]|uniref:hypothetical protein n=1 Tax=Sphingomonas sp. AOB5 TaxID=3034017 RepID=UPI0023F6F30A|nr:hypothetical protein [Sphingomonas sp. AOB5]MDF7773803.1 hypothetical protein [Sphingomonas sp. AOB5]